MKNVFQIWMENNRKTSFFVRKETWSSYSAFLVTEITTGQKNHPITEGNPYGFAYGYFYNNGKRIESKIGLSGAGSYNWKKLNKKPMVLKEEVKNVSNIVR